MQIDCNFLGDNRYRPGPLRNNMCLWMGPSTHTVHSYSYPIHASESSSRKCINPLRTKTTLYLFLRGNKSLLYHQIGNRNVLIFITIQWNFMFCVDKIKYEHLAILSNLKSCQLAPRIVTFNLCICCQFEASQIISPKIIPMSHRNI